MPKKKPEDDILSISNKLEKGQHIIVTWIDASESKGIPINSHVLDNDAVETRKTTVGIFVNVQKSEAYHELHLIVGIEKTDNTWQINSIPLCLIKKVEISNLKTPLSTIKQRRKRLWTKLKNGGIKYIGF